MNIWIIIFLICKFFTWQPHKIGSKIGTPKKKKKNDFQLVLSTHAQIHTYTNIEYLIGLIRLKHHLTFVFRFNRSANLRIIFFSALIFAYSLIYSELVRDFFGQFLNFEQFGEKSSVMKLNQFPQFDDDRWNEIQMPYDIRHSPLWRLSLELDISGGAVKSATIEFQCLFHSRHAFVIRGVLCLHCDLLIGMIKNTSWHIFSLPTKSMKIEIDRHLFSRTKQKNENCSRVFENRIKTPFER